MKGVGRVATFDPRLEYAASARAATQPAMLEVLVRLRNQDEGYGDSLSALEKAGMRLRAMASGPYTIVSGEIAAESLPALERIAGIRHVEASRPLTQELDLCVPEVNAHIPHAACPAIRGAGTLIGIIDTGIDFRHPDFLNPDGTSRVYVLWDQDAQPVAHSAVIYGREYTRDQINASLKEAIPAADRPRVDPDGHGTHICGIAAGGGNARPTHLGLAPDADLIVVALSKDYMATHGRSVKAFEAFAYVVRQAAGRPVAINFSEGMNGGGHCGETALETALDNFARLPNVAIIKSAGNEQQMCIHASGVLRKGETREAQMKGHANNRRDDVIEIWFDDGDDISVALRPPGDETTPFVGRGASGVFPTRAGNTVSIKVDEDAEHTGDTVATVIISHGAATAIKPGEWALLLRAEAVRVGRFDAWIERTVLRHIGEQTHFTNDSNDPTETISIPGTARNVITVGAYVTRADDPDGASGQVAPFSGRGPTRYGQCKPELVAPGAIIESALRGTQKVAGSSGTSMAAAVVTGAAALIMSQRGGLTCTQLKQILTRSARYPSPAAAVPDNAWGHGMLDVQAAIELAARAKFPAITDVRIEGSKLFWNTDVATTGSVRFQSSRRQLLLGKNTLSVGDASLSRSHQVTLAGQPPGKYFCLLTSVSEDGFSTEDDNGGECHEVYVDWEAPEQADALVTLESEIPA
jgi:subtilisin family serine protease